MGKLFKQNIFVSLFEKLFTWEKASSRPDLFSRQPFSMLLFPFFIPESSVFHLDTQLLNSPQKNTDSHFANSASVIELCDFFHGNYYSALTGISKRGSCISSRDAASALGRSFFKFFTLSARYMYHADNVEVNPFFLDSPAYFKRLQSISDRNSSVDSLFKAVKDKMPKGKAVLKMQSVECRFLKQNKKKKL